MRQARACAAGSVFGILAALIVLSCGRIEARTVRVGVYDNPPKVERGRGKAPRGMFIDIIQYIARREHWRIEYVEGTWDEGLTRLEKDSIDLMPDVAFSETRNQRFDFNQLTVLCSWLQIFCAKDRAIESVAGLQGKTVAVLHGSIQQEVSEEIRARLGLSFDEIVLPDYESAIREVETGRADAMIASRFYGYRREEEPRLVPAPVILRPTTLRFAAPKGRNRDLLDAIDKHLAQMMNEPRSAYYRTLLYWLHEKPRTFVPRFLLWAIAATGVTLLFFCVWVLVLRWQVRKRTRELDQSNRELRAALEEIKLAREEALNRERLHALGQLACGLAHDFNNLLAPIVSYADLMLTDTEELKDVERVKANLRQIKNAGWHGTDIVSRLQQFYRSTEETEEKEQVDTNAVVRETVELAKERWKGLARKGVGIELVLELGPDCEITARKSHIHEMLLNLLLNAADAMPEGGRLEISTENRGDGVCITAKDSGVGMTEEVREKCMTPFFTTKGAKGTGMGLTMVNNILAQHGARIDIVSAPGAGTSFVITFPFSASGDQSA